MRQEEIILSALTKDIDYAKKVLPHLKHDFFSDRKEQVTYKLIDEFFTKYQKLPTRDILLLSIESVKDIPESEFPDTKTVIKEAFDSKYEYDQQWLLDETEKFCKNKAVYNAIMRAVLIINGEDKKTGEGAIPSLLQDALSITFDKKLGHDYFEDAAARYEFYHSVESKIPFTIDLLNKVTNGGVNRKSLNLFISPPKGGKSLSMCSLAADYLRAGLNVAYITLELAEERVAERIDANMFNVPMSSIHTLEEDVFTNKIALLRSKTNGRLKIKEYATKTASHTNFKVWLDDLKTKEGFTPDVLFVDYLGICASSKYKNSSTVNSYAYQQSVSEELRALAFEYDMAVWSAVQTNRSGFNTSDFDIDSIADSTGPIQTCDFAIAVINTPELQELQQALLKQLASRYGDPSYYNKFVVGIDKSRMKMYNVEQSAQDGITQDVSNNTSPNPPSRYKSAGTKPTVATNDDWSFE